MARQRYSKTDHRYWVPKVFKPKKLRRGKRYQSPFWCVRLQHETGRTTFPLATSNREAAAAHARDIYVFMLANGWKPTLREFKSGSFATPAQKRPGATIGEFLDELAAIRGELRLTLIQGQENIRVKLAQIFRDERTGQRWAPCSLSFDFNESLNSWKEILDWPCGPNLDVVDLKNAGAMGMTAVDR